MKKVLLSCAIAAFALAQGLAADYTFGYAIGDFISPLKANTSCYGEAIMVPGDLQNAYGEDAQITELNVALGSFGTQKTDPRNVNIFISESLTGEALYTQTAALVPEQYNKVVLDTPFAFEGKDIYVGFTIAGCTNADAPVVCDGAQDLPNSYIAFGASFPAMNQTWAEIQGNNFGNVALNLTISSSKDLKNFIYPMATLTDSYASVNEPFLASSIVRNLGLEGINTITVDYQVGDAEMASAELEVASTFQPGAFGYVDFDLIGKNLGLGQKVSLSFAKVNGEENAYNTMFEAGEIDLLEAGTYFPRPVVIEEGTGNTCPWCVRGIVGMEKMRETYTNGTYFGICAHTYAGSDPMYCGSYSRIASTIYGSNYPTAAANRMAKFDPSPETCEGYYNMIHESFYSQQKVDIEALYETTEFKDLVVTCSLTSTVDLDEHALGIALVTTEDNVGPYVQSNAYAGGRYGEMGGFESKGSAVSMIYNDVARTIVDWSGNKEVVPTQLVANQPAECQEMKITVTNVKDINNGYLTAMLIDTTSGWIISANRIKLPEAIWQNVTESGVEAIDADGVAAEYYTLDGLRVNNDVLAPGLYIKKAGEKTTKVLVK